MAMVFLSYASMDRLVAARLASGLKERGVVPWIDAQDLGVGDALPAAIASAIEAADYVVVLLTKASVESSWVRLEMQLALSREVVENRVILLPAVVEDCELPNYVRHKSYADFRAPAKFDDVVVSLLRTMGIVAAGPASIDTSAGASKNKPLHTSYEDLALVPSETLHGMPEKLFSAAKKLKADVTHIVAAHSNSVEICRKRLVAYLFEKDLVLIEPLQVSLLRGTELVYHDWVPAGDRSVRNVVGEGILREWETQLREGEGLVFWLDHSSNDPLLDARTRNNCALFSRVGETGMIIIVEMHWGENFPLFERQMQKLTQEIESARIEVVSGTASLMRALRFDPEFLHNLPRAKFTDLVQELFEGEGFTTARPGREASLIGGIDLIVVPKQTPVPVWGVVQIKHQSVPNVPTGVDAITSFRGVTIDLPAELYFLVTNTHFTEPAKWAAAKARLPLRLRDKTDLRQWLKGEYFVKGHARDIPEKIEFYPGFEIEIPQSD